MTPTEIRDLRERLGLSKEEFSARVGVTLRLVNYWESGGRTPGGAAKVLLAKMAKAKRKA